MIDRGYLRVQKIKDIGNMISIDDVIDAIDDAMGRCNAGSLIWETYNAVREMYISIDNQYEEECKKDIGSQVNDEFLTKLIRLDDSLKN
jgi:hypothetical protein